MNNDIKKDRFVNKEENRYIIDDYGNLLDEFTNKDKFKITRKNSLENYKKIKKYQKMEVFIMNDPIKKNQYIYDNLTNNEIGFLDRIINNIQYNNCMLMKNKYIPIRTIKDFTEVGKLSKQGVITVLKKLIDLKIIYKTDKKLYNYYFINPYIYFKGNDINKSLEYAYQEYNVVIDLI